jgi:hypothetical protein
MMSMETYKVTKTMHSKEALHEEGENMKKDRCLECKDIIQAKPPLCKCGKGMIGTGWITRVKKDE